MSGICHRTRGAWGMVRTSQNDQRCAMWTSRDQRYRSSSQRDDWWVMLVSCFFLKVPCHKILRCTPDLVTTHLQQRQQQPPIIIADGKNCRFHYFETAQLNLGIESRDDMLTDCTDRRFVNAADHSQHQNQRDRSPR